MTENTASFTLDYYKHVFESVHDAIIATDLNYHVRAWNRAAERIYGWRAEEVTGKALDTFLQTQFLEDEDLASVRASFEQKGYWEGTVMQRRRDGSAIYIHSSVSLLYDAAGMPTGTVGVNHDVTELYQTQDELRRSLDRERSLRSTRDRFITNTNHEFRTPLSIILAAVDTLERYHDRMSAEQRQDRYTTMRQQVWSLIAMLNDVLAVDRLDSEQADLSLERFNICEFLALLLDEARMKHPERVWTLACGSHVEWIVGDRALLRTAVMHLLNNAVKFSAADKPIETALTHVNGYACLSVRDYGIGIPAHDLEHLWDVFFRGSNIGTIRGNGLGLPLAKRIAQAHHGLLDVQSVEGQGSTFTLSLPINQADIPTPSPDE